MYFKINSCKKIKIRHLFFGWKFQRMHLLPPPLLTVNGQIMSKSEWNLGHCRWNWAHDVQRCRWPNSDTQMLETVARDRAAQQMWCRQTKASNSQKWHGDKPTHAHRSRQIQGKMKRKVTNRIQDMVNPWGSFSQVQMICEADVSNALSLNIGHEPTRALNSRQTQYKWTIRQLNPWKQTKCELVLSLQLYLRLTGVTCKAQVSPPLHKHDIDTNPNMTLSSFKRVDADVVIMCNGESAKTTWWRPSQRTPNL